MLLSFPRNKGTYAPYAKATLSRVFTDNKSIEHAMCQPLFQQKERETPVFHGLLMHKAPVNQAVFVYTRSPKRPQLTGMTQYY